MGELAALLDQIHSDGFSDLPVDSALAVFDEINDRSTVEDVPALLGALDSDRANFWTREMLSDPLCRLGGPSILGPLLVAFDRGLAEGHDNDSFQLHLWELVEDAPEESAEVLRELRGSDEISDKTIDWLMEFCEPEPRAADDQVQVRAHWLRRPLSTYLRIAVNVSAH